MRWQWRSVSILKGRHVRTICHLELSSHHQQHQFKISTLTSIYFKLTASIEHGRHRETNLALQEANNGNCEPQLDADRSRQSHEMASGEKDVYFYGRFWLRLRDVGSIAMLTQ